MPWPDSPLCHICSHAEAFHDTWGCTVPGCRCDRGLVDGNRLPPPEPEVDPWVGEVVREHLAKKRTNKPRGPRK